MKHPVRKLICAVLVAVILLVPAWLSLQAAARASVREKEADRNVNRLKGLSTLFDRIVADETVLSLHYINDVTWDFNMRTYGMKESVDGENYPTSGSLSITIVDVHNCTVIGKEAFTGCETVFVFAPKGGTTQEYCEMTENPCVFVEMKAQQIKR
jgi:hypothetical protein